MTVETRTISIEDVELTLSPEGVSTFLSNMMDAGTGALRELGIDMHYALVIYPCGHPEASWMTGNDVDLRAGLEAANQLVDFIEAMIAGNPGSGGRLN